MARQFLTSNVVRSVLMTAASGEVPMTAAASATGFVYGSPFVDMNGYNEITFFAAPSSTGAARSKIKLQMASTTATSAEDITGSKVTATAAHQMIASSIVKPGKRFMKALVATTGGALGKIGWVQSQARDLAISNHITGASGAVVGIVYSAATGTA